MIGRLFRTGSLDFTKVIAVTGSEVKRPHYLQVVAGAKIEGIVPDADLTNATAHVRRISGNVLTGRAVATDDFLGYYSNQVTVIPEGDHYELL